MISQIRPVGVCGLYQQSLRRIVEIESDFLKVRAVNVFLFGTAFGKSEVIVIHFLLLIKLLFKEIFIVFSVKIGVYELIGNTFPLELCVLEVDFIESTRFVTVTHELIVMLVEICSFKPLYHLPAVFFRLFHLACLLVVLLAKA